MAMLLGAAAMLGGSALAATYDVPEVQTHRLNRWAFDARGPNESQIAYRYCTRDRLVTVNSRRTASDWTAMVLSAGWYTPAHVTLGCEAPR
jgi:hypothetical protein